MRALKKQHLTEGRFSLEDLYDLVKRDRSLRQFREQLTLSHTSYQQLLEDGISYLEAAVYAERLGFHAFEVWGMQWVSAATAIHIPVQLTFWDAV